MIDLLHGALDGALAVIHATSNDDDQNGGILALLAAGPAVGVAIWVTVFRRYRNTDKSNQFERETKVDAQPVKGYDRKVNELRGTRNPHIDGRNESAFRQRVKREQ